MTKATTLDEEQQRTSQQLQIMRTSISDALQAATEILRVNPDNWEMTNARDRLTEANMWARSYGHGSWWKQ